MTHALFDPITVRDLTVRNRIWVSPMCQYSVERQDGVPTPWHLVHLGGFAKGGAGAVVVEATGVVPEGRISPQDLGLWNDEQRDAFRPIVDFLHDQGAAAGIQLAHAGRKASTFRPWEDTHGSVPVDQGGWSTVAPSAVAFGGYAAPRELEPEDIRVVALAFAAAARRAVDAGFDLVELHAAHGYLLHQFLSPLSNHRTDAYGGSLENRARALLEVLDAVRAEVGAGFPVVVRFSATDWVDGGLTLDETTQVARWAAEHGADLADVSTGGNVASAPIPVGPGYQVPFAAALKRDAGVRTIAVGMISDAFQAEQVVATGQADVVMVGREFLRDPAFPLRAAVELGVHVDYEPQQYHRARVTA
ncbi:NADH:flavin oxidoreductase/NADH oxidase [Curtobacterium sp. Csp1]|uniref:NADH:flavin oxidoreductase/NADH oxidase n=1 Tax=Curtobacterium citreum TaxID=2036 RepID=A0ABT2HE44_9MICO|nr:MULTISPECIES: NADH:flavin oxidoreductase/NADH oxidase [Curtobacterium]MCS6521529.1 NADH:flavin oxidoreductase/NADH oxidase [Curtobacterium citreum]QKS11869.1 NADH:flavin oxidoreductase/NADH oxidase [Curtobacterium sp. csp3]QKS19603.1 NADH:flavin oxidoreductase/NADH oxidase [Curtobacterium sp. Csp1]RDH99411.1 2,4-dienoyl-CoA reductase-like NADH-dependent reductase (Old Yellow Enzyme family) [Curtobacterium sp. AG1037]TQJ28386.1 2,4-dienoyl-CoA reductase-like NADH-dependent reductase (Old Yel